MQHPFIGHQRLWYYLSAWGLITLIHTLALREFYMLPWFPALTDALIFNVAFYGLGLSYWYVVRYINTKGPISLNLILTHAIGVTVLLTLVLFGSKLTLELLFSSDTDYRDMLSESMPWRFFLGLLYFLNIILIYYLIKYYTVVQEKSSTELNLKNLVKEAELSMLKLQINPHFIFNSLNSISALTLGQPDKAREMIIKLSAFLRHSLGKNPREQNTLKEEISHVQDYLDIEKVRFGDKLRIRFQVQEACERVPVPHLILQPLFENAIKYGVYESLEQVNIDVHCEIHEKQLHIRIHNGYDPEAVTQKGKGLGLQNVRERLRLVYGGQAHLEVLQENGHFEVRIRIPEQLSIPQ